MGVLCEGRISVRIKRQGEQDSNKTNNDIRGRDLAGEVMKRKENGCCKNENVTIDVRNYKSDKIRNQIISETTKEGELSKKM